jgi:hypothetical protein
MQASYRGWHRKIFQWPIFILKLANVSQIKPKSRKIQIPIRKLKARKPSDNENSRDVCFFRRTHFCSLLSVLLLLFFPGAYSRFLNLSLSSHLLVLVLGSDAAPLPGVNQDGTVVRHIHEKLLVPDAKPLH